MINLIRLPLQNAYNVRELGGYATSAGSTAWHRFLRGDDLSTLSDEDITYLKNYGVRSVIDLRSNEECKQQPDRLASEPDMTYYHIPFMVGNVDNIMDQVVSNFKLSEFYLGLLKEETIVRRLMSCIAEAPSGTILFHCAGGKDRTGVLSMLLLSLAGVCREDILTNYQVSYCNLRRNMAIQNMQIPKDMDLSCMYSNPEDIEQCIDYIMNTYGSTSSYLLHCGVQTGEIDVIIKRIQEEYSTLEVSDSQHTNGCAYTAC